MSTQASERDLLPHGFGIFLALLASVAAVFLGASAGMTLSIALPAALTSFVFLSLLLKHGGSAENAMVQTLVSTAVAGATAAVFFAPAFLISDRWKEVPYWTVALLVAGGGIAGVLFATQFRKASAGEALAFPEGEACGQLLVGLTKTGAVRKILGLGLALGAGLKAASALLGALRSSVEGAWAAGRTVFYIGAETSPALLGIGYLAGARTVTALFVGSAVSWFLTLPFLGWDAVTHPDPLGWSWLTWNTRLRYLGVGGLAVASLWALFQSRRLVASGLRGVLIPQETKETAGPDLPAPLRVSLMMSAAVFLGIACWLETHSIGLTGLGVATALVFSLVSALVGGSMAGLVGISLAPVTALGLGILLFSGPIMQAMAPLASLESLLLIVVFAAAAAGLVSGALSQSFRVGEICEVRPARLQLGALLGVGAGALIVALPLRYLHFAYGVGTGGKGALTPTQANLFAGMAHGIVTGGEVPWTWVGLGIKIAIAFVILDEALRARGSRFRLPVLAVTLGMYLPISLVLPVCLGGWLSLLSGVPSTRRLTTAFASGLIGGETLVGVLVAIFIVGNPQWVPLRLIDSAALSLGAMSLLALALGILAKKET